MGLLSGGTERIFAGSVRECGVRVSTVVSLMRKNPPFVQCKVELESTAASLRHILISPGVRRGLSQSGEERQGENSAQRQCGRVPAPPSLTTV